MSLFSFLNMPQQFVHFQLRNVVYILYVCVCAHTAWSPEKIKKIHTIFGIITSHTARNPILFSGLCIPRGGTTLSLCLSLSSRRKSEDFLYVEPPLYRSGVEQLPHNVINIREKQIKLKYRIKEIKQSSGFRQIFTLAIDRLG